MQVSGKQDTYYLYIKEDLSKFYHFSQKIIVFRKKRKSNNKLSDKSKIELTIKKSTFEEISKLDS